MSPATFILATAMLGLATVAVRAQGTAPPWAKPGDTVKVWAETPSLRGAPALVRGSASDTIYFTVRSAVSRSWLETPIAQGQITRVDVRDSAAHSAGRTLLGGVAGTVIGAAITGGMVYFAYQAVCPTRNNDCDGGGGEQIDRAVFTTFGAVGGALAGGVIGGILGRRPVLGWRRVFP